MPSALPCRAVSALGSNGWRRLPSRALLLPPRREESERLALHPRCLCVQTANACRTGRAFVTLPLTSHLPHESGRTQKRHRVRLATPQISSRSAKLGVWSAAEGDRLYGG